MSRKVAKKLGPTTAPSISWISNSTPINSGKVLHTKKSNIIELWILSKVNRRQSIYQSNK